MANKRYRFDNGQVIVLTPGEVTAIERMAQMNGTDPLKIQFDPGFVQRRTLNNLRDKGVLTQETDRGGCYHFAEGFLPVVSPSINRADKFTMADREVTEAELTSRQAIMLRALQDKRRGGVWYPGCGMHWNNASSTHRILMGLVNKGLATVEYPQDQGYALKKWGFFRLNEAGMARKVTHAELDASF